MAKKYPFTKANVQETQEAVYKYIVEYISANAYSPSIRDICVGVGLKSTSTVHNHLRRLSEEGLIQFHEGKRRTIRVPALDAVDSQEIPLVGTVTAGKPVLATENIECLLPLPLNVWSSTEELFALRVKGDSMADAAILDGDIVIVEKRSSAEHGEIVVALLDDEATVKSLKRDQHGSYYLHPENELYDDIPLNDCDAIILGVVRGLLRTDV
ncbi:MAG: transcriptional repressor LexA [Clostridiaceae bacterium]|jgi:repressor LexA|nr:transcriptional repressor LexA [Clostridia bacterium]MBP6950161.1 transcriptional repressor LexA [Clostridia bacterium]NMA36114.1 transcriptional repressor LexA [Clostridiaceae bacterium]HPY63383.1 transcriptional repressor LexA [Bacillota bacterium]